eukprot:SAG22_NODE_284_length_13033_cov_21.541828_6_plen_143_part_00
MRPRPPPCLKNASILPICLRYASWRAPCSRGLRNQLVRGGRAGRHAEQAQAARSRARAAGVAAATFLRSFGNAPSAARDCRLPRERASEQQEQQAGYCQGLLALVPAHHRHRPRPLAESPGRQRGVAMIPRRAACQCQLQPA